MKPMTAKYDGVCRGCGAEILAGEPMLHQARGENFHPSCAPATAKAASAWADRPRGDRVASREEQHGTYLDCGPAAWDDR